MGTLYKVKPDLPPEEQQIVLANGIDPDETLWLAGCRNGRGIAASERYGTFRQTYTSSPGKLSPTGRMWDNMPMRYFVSVE